MCSVFEFLKIANDGVFPSTIGEYLYGIMALFAGFAAAYGFLYPLLLPLMGPFSDGYPRKNIYKFTAIVDFWLMLVCFISGFFMTPDGGFIWFK